MKNLKLSLQSSVLTLGIFISMAISTPGQTQTSSPPVIHFRAKATAYNPVPGQGGNKDSMGRRLHTFQDYLRGATKYVSVAMDPKIKWGTCFHSREVDAILAVRLGHPVVVPFCKTDTGSDFQNTGTSRIDICTDTPQKSMNLFNFPFYNNVAKLFNTNSEIFNSVLNFVVINAHVNPPGARSAAVAAQPEVQIAPPLHEVIVR